MIPDSPAAALGNQSSSIRAVVIEVVRDRHERAAEAHQVSGSRYSMGFGTQWRDLLDDFHDATRDRGYQTYKLAPGGHKIPIVNDCLVYVWRVPQTPDAVSLFANSPTRKNSFVASPPPPTLFEPEIADGASPTLEAEDGADLQQVVGALSDTMPVVLVMVDSTPWQLQSMDWAVATLDDSGAVKLLGQEQIWVPELVAHGPADEVEPFDSGTPVSPIVGVQEYERPQTDA